MDPEALTATIRKLERELIRARREISQWKRTAETSETMSRLSKSSLLRTNADLEQTIAELERQQRKVEEASLAKSQFLATMSHEIRTPMNGVLGTLELLLDSGLNAEQQELAQISYNSSTALLSILNDTLDFSKIEAGALSLHKSPMDLVNCVNAVVSTMRSAAERRGLTLTATLDASLPEMVLGDKVRVRQILLNLVGNAIKFTDEGNIEVFVSSPTNDRVRFEVQDSGIGIAPEDRGGIFDTFQQADGTATRRHGGTGLGLAICRELVGMMNGQIWVESVVGEGSRFFFDVELPEHQRDVTQPIVPIQENAPALDLVRKILVVDDNEVNQLVASRMLRNMGYEVETAGDGLEAVGLVGRGDYDVVLMDCTMPVMDGYEATRRIRELNTGRENVPIVAMTARAFADDRQKCLDAGMNGYLAKPMQRQELVRAISEAFATLA